MIGFVKLRILEPGFLLCIAHQKISCFLLVIAVVHPDEHCDLRGDIVTIIIIIRIILIIIIIIIINIIIIGNLIIQTNTAS